MYETLGASAASATRQHPGPSRDSTKMSQVIPTSELRASLEKHNQIFESLLRLIPARFYLSYRPFQDTENIKRIQNEGTSQKMSSGAKRGPKARKLDPNNHKTVIDIQESLAESLHATRRKNPSKSRKEKDLGVSRTDADNSDDAMDDDPRDTQSGNVTELHERYRSRLASFRKERGEVDDDDDGTGVKKREEREKTRKARKEKKERRKKREREKRSATKVQLVVPEPDKHPIEKDNEANVTFSAIPDQPNPKHHKRVVTTSNPHQALAQITAREKKLASLPEEKRAEIEGKDKLVKAQMRLAGVKVKDDVEKLKKSITHKERAKAKSAKEWEERKKNLIKEQAVKQQKRSDNIAMRNDRRKEKRLHLKSKAKGKALDKKSSSSGKPKTKKA
ncbi:surfeit locus protein 6-domain-containing protein [Cantharellus anzutake]|uniref:surfeit locus protein 6-domain-containing protein n=1 Tax=Cantharellus anzutake TaxID=1750568 RepID=UPI001906C1F3|nr:surfeit locus protein 6-domain-containing protein [Cantharellus anzutake]KAF8337035.1 surfeit locus protein 6-domain-containing protein [Cantharellus anzutake]